MVNRALMVKWIDALRSGDYPQIRGFLHTTEGLDCLGVLCDVVDPNGWNMEKPYTVKPSNIRPNPVPYYEFLYKGQTSTYTLPDALVADLGVEDNFAYYMVELSDKKGLDFNQIAEILERSYVVN